MYRRLILIIFIIGFALLGATQESQIKLQTVFEQTFEDTIVDVIFDTATVSLEKAKAMGWKEEAFTLTEKANGKITIPYPCVLITKEKVSFLDKEGKEKKSIKMLVEGVKWEGKEGVHIGKGRINVSKSKNGEYLALAIPREGTTLGEGEKGDLAIYRKDGKEMWEIEDVYLSAGYIIPSPNGKYAITLPPEEYPAGAPAFYSKEGIKYLKVREWNNGWKRGYAVEDFDFSEDGKYVVTAIYDFPTGNVGYIGMFDERGRDMWIKRRDYRVEEVSFLNNISSVILAERKPQEYVCHFVLFDLNGNDIWSSEENLPLAEYKYFMKAKDTIFVSFGIKGKGTVYNNNVYTIDIHTGKVTRLFGTRLSDRFEGIMSATQNSLLLKGERNIYHLLLGERKVEDIQTFEQVKKPKDIITFSRTIIIIEDTQIRVLMMLQEGGK